MRMTFLVVLAGLTGAAIAAPPPKPAPRTTVALFERNLGFTLPAGYQRLTDKNNGTNVLIEYAPVGETLANWTRLVTVQAYRGLGSSPEPTATIARRAFYPAACKRGPIYRDFGETALSREMRRTIVANGCASLPPGAYPQALAGAGEQDFIMIFRDAETIYALNYAERGAPFAGKAPPRSPEAAAAILAGLFGAVSLDPVH